MHSLLRWKDFRSIRVVSSVCSASLANFRLASYRSPILVVSALFTLTACGGSDHPTQPPATVTPPHETTVPISNSGYVEARTSQIVTNGGPPSQVFDDFSVAAGATITTVGWQGIYCVQQVNAAAPAPTASAFTVSFYPDAAGRPNLAGRIQTSTYTVAQTGQVFEKNVAGLTCGTAMNTTWPFYKYSVTLPTAFVATAGTKYWISIQATTPSYDVYFGWRDGTPNDNSSLQLFQGVYTTYNVDRAYSLK